MKTFVLALLTCMALTTACLAMTPAPLPAHSSAVRVDWQDPQQLPPRFRNHCSFENFTGRPYCSNHCGSDYQFTFCSVASFGCCRLGRGYCDFSGLLRCSP
ncbi:MAG: hypothetical protein ABSE22_18855 [Xanthobacteraceae bacterium]|jgi:hypothetical protein